MFSLVSICLPPLSHRKSLPGIRTNGTNGLTASQSETTPTGQRLLSPLAFGTVPSVLTWCLYTWKQVFCCSVWIYLYMVGYLCIWLDISVYSWLQMTVLPLIDWTTHTTLYNLSPGIRRKLAVQVRDLLTLGKKLQKFWIICVHFVVS